MPAPTVNDLRLSQAVASSPPTYNDVLVAAVAKGTMGMDVDEKPVMKDADTARDDLGLGKAQTPEFIGLKISEEQGAGNLRPGYVAYYNGGAPGNIAHISRAFSIDGVDWCRDAKNPILSAGTGWESSHVKDPWAVIVDNVIYLYYSGWNTTNYQIGLAISKDFGRTFTKYAGNPVVPIGAPGSWDAKNLVFPIVFYDEDEIDPSKRWKMWYAGEKVNNTASLGYAYSADGINWTKFGLVVSLGSPGEFDDGILRSGAMIKENGTYYWFYAGNHSVAGRTQWTVGLITFTDPEGVYTKHGQVLPALTNRIGTLTADTLLGSAVVLVPDSSVFQVDEYVYLTDTDSTPMLSRIKSIDSPTQVTLRDAAVANYTTARSAALNSAYSWSVEGRSVYRQNGRWIMAVTLFQSCPGYITETCGWAYNLNDPPTGPWTFDLAKGIALEPSVPDNEPASVENWRILPVRYSPAMRSAEWANETPTQVLLATRRLTARAIAPFAGYGAISTVSGTPDVVGSGTRFLSQVSVGDRLTVGNETLRVSSVSDDTHLTVTSDFLNSNSAATYTVRPYIFRADKSDGTPQVLILDDGNLLAPVSSLDRLASGNQSGDLFDLPDSVNEFYLLFDSGTYYFYHHDYATTLKPLKVRSASTIAGLASASDTLIGLNAVYPCVVKSGSTYHLYVWVGTVSKHYTSSSPTGPFTYSDDLPTSPNVLTDPDVALNPADGLYYLAGKELSPVLKVRLYRSSSLSGPWSDLGEPLSNLTIPSWMSQEQAEPNLWFSAGRMFLAFSGYDGYSQGIGAVEINLQTFKAVTQPILLVDPSLPWQQVAGSIKVSAPVFCAGNSVDLLDRLYFSHNPSGAGVSSGWGYLEASLVPNSSPVQSFSGRSGNIVPRQSDYAANEPLVDAATVTPSVERNSGGVLSSLSQPTTIANPVGVPADGQTYRLRIKSTVSRALTWGGQFRGSTSLALPTATTGSGLTDYLLFVWNSADSKWDLLTTNFGF